MQNPLIKFDNPLGGRVEIPVVTDGKRLNINVWKNVNGVHTPHVGAALSALVGGAGSPEVYFVDGLDGIKGEITVLEV